MGGCEPSCSMFMLVKIIDFKKRRKKRTLASVYRYLVVCISSMWMDTAHSVSSKCTNKKCIHWTNYISNNNRMIWRLFVKKSRFCFWCIWSKANIVIAIASECRTLSMFIWSMHVLKWSPYLNARLNTKKVTFLVEQKKSNQTKVTVTMLRLFRRTLFGSNFSFKKNFVVNSWFNVSACELIHLWMGKKANKIQFWKIVWWSVTRMIWTEKMEIWISISESSALVQKIKLENYSGIWIIQNVIPVKNEANDRNIPSNQMALQPKCCFWQKYSKTFT